MTVVRATQSSSRTLKYKVGVVVVVAAVLATFRLQYEDDDEYEFSVLSTCCRFGGRNVFKCACSELETHTGSNPRTPIYRSLLSLGRGNHFIAMILPSIRPGCLLLWLQK